MAKRSVKKIMLPIKTLQQRFVFYMLLPVTLLMLIMGAIGFVYARNALLQQWEEAAVLKLQRAAHHVDMRLTRPKELVKLYLAFVEGHRHAMPMLQQLLSVLEHTEGVVAVNLKNIAAPDPSPDPVRRPSGDKRIDPKGQGGMGARHRWMMSAQRFRVTLPRYDPDSSSRTVSIITQAVSEDNHSALQVEVILDFDFLLQDIPYTGWWQSHKAFLIDDVGNVLVSTSSTRREQLGKNGDPLEQKTLQALQANVSGTVRGVGSPSAEISGFYRLAEAPWYIVVFAPGAEILRPIIRFRNYYFITLGFFIVVILLLIRRVTGRTVQAVDRLSNAAENIARGDFGAPLPVQTDDEIGELTRSFNTMSVQLKDRMRMRQSLDLAKEVQQNLLPDQTPQVDGLDIAGRSIYCEETGGDYFDYLHANDGLHIVVGDVSGHGIPAALLMSSVRAGLRQCHRESEDIGALVSDLNRNIAMDVGDSGRFVTLFYLTVNPAGGRIQWVRAGHDPGMVYRREGDTFEDLAGRGLALGVDADYRYSSETREDVQSGDIILLGTDGIWEACDDSGRMYGKKALRAIVHKHRDDRAQVIITAIFDSVHRFIGGARAADDMTLVVIKIA